MFGSVLQMLGWAVPHLAGDLGPGDLALQQVEVKGQDTWGLERIRDRT